jgi:hypothetical protein
MHELNQPRSVAKILKVIKQSGAGNLACSRLSRRLDPLESRSAGWIARQIFRAPASRLIFPQTNQTDHDRARLAWKGCLPALPLPNYSWKIALSMASTDHLSKRHAVRE